MARYEIKIAAPEGGRPVVMTMERPDDMAALDCAMKICSEHTVEVWDGSRRIGVLTLSGTPRLAF